MYSKNKLLKNDSRETYTIETILSDERSEVPKVTLLPIIIMITREHIVLNKKENNENVKKKRQ